MKKGDLIHWDEASTLDGNIQVIKKIDQEYLIKLLRSMEAQLETLELRESVLKKQIHHVKKVLKDNYPHWKILEEEKSKRD